jgi:hypothetical protein
VRSTCQFFSFSSPSRAALSLSSPTTVNSRTPHPQPRALPRAAHPPPVSTPARCPVPRLASARRNRSSERHLTTAQEGQAAHLAGSRRPEVEPAHTTEVAGARGGGRRVGAEPARSLATGSGRSPRFFLDSSNSGESLLLPSSSTAASPYFSSRSSQRAMQHSSHRGLSLSALF